MIGITLFLLVAQEKAWDNRGPAPQTKGGYNVELVGWVDSVGVVEGLEASEDGKVIYINTDSTGVVVVDILDPADPYIYRVIRHDSLRWIGPISRVGNYLYVWWTDWYYKYVVVHEWNAYDISDPLNPVFAKTVYHYEGPHNKPPGRWWNALPPDPVHDTIFYAVGDFLSFNVKDPLSPDLLGILDDYASMHYLLYPYDYGCSSDTPYSYYYIVDVSDPYHMRLVHKDSVPVDAMDYPWGAIRTVSVWERGYDRRRFMYLLGEWDMFCFDVTNPTNPVKLNQWRYYTWQGYVLGSIVHGDRLYTSENRYPSGEQGLVVRSLSSDPANPTVVGYYYHEAGDSVQGPYTPMIWVNGYVIGLVSGPGGGGIGIYRYSGESLPEDTGRYLDWITTVYRGPGLRFSISRKAEVSFKLYNILGQRVYERNLGVLEPGPHQVSLPDMGSGVYFLFMKADEAILRKKLIFLR